MKKLPLRGQVAVVTGSTRGAGKGIALALGEAGATVYVTGRSSREGAPPEDGAPGTVEDTAEEVTARGGRGIPVCVDCTSEQEVAQLFARVEAKQGRLDVLANAVWGGNERLDVLAWGRPFWEQPMDAWERTMGAGPRAYVLASREAARRMAAQGSGGLIVHVTDGLMADGSKPYAGHLATDLAHACIDRMVEGMSADLRPFHVAVLALMPGFMRTERVLRHLKTDAQKRQMRFDLSETPEYLGRAVAALAADPQRLRHTGQRTWVADLAREYGFTDLDGRQPARFDPAAPEQPLPPVP